MSKSRTINFPPQADYIILYTFLYKYCSDTVRDFLDFALKDKELTIDEAYKNSEFQAELVFDSLKMNGFYIKKSDALIEDVINDGFDKPGFLADFLKIFPESVIFNSEYHNIKYFNLLFKTIDDEIDTSEFDEELNSAISEIISLISKLNVFDSDFEFREVYDIVASSRFMHVNSNPQFVTQILIAIVLSEKKHISSVYDPFMKDGSSIMRLYEHLGFGLKYCYGKDQSRINLCHVLVKLFINSVSLNDVFIKQEDALDSIDINGASFDAIISKIPIAIKNYYSSNYNQGREIAKRNRRSELESFLMNNLGIDDDSFKQDSELNQALENLVDKIDFNDSGIDFTGQYAQLMDSEFLFLINLIDSLKEDGIMAVSISENFLFKNSLELLRKYLTEEKNYIDAIIRIPSEIIRSRPEIVIVFRKNKKSDNILFIDMSADYETKKSGLVYPGLFRKNFILDEKTMSKMENVFANRLSLPKYSNLISIEEIEENNFNLSVSRYVDTFEGEFITLEELVGEKREIESNIHELNLKIEKMMDDLNINF